MDRSSRRGRLRSRHWSQIGEATAEDTEILGWARLNRHAILTNDLDFGTLLALTAATGPSVIQLRGLRLAPRHAAPFLIATLQAFREAIEAGALLILDETSSRVRLLPLKT